MQGFTTMVRRIWSALLKAKADSSGMCANSARSEIRPLSGAFRKRTSLRNPADRTRILAHARGIRSQASQHQLLLLKLTAIHKQSPSFISEDGDCCSYIYVACLRLFLYRRYSIACSAINISQSRSESHAVFQCHHTNCGLRYFVCKSGISRGLAFKPSKTC